MPRAERDMRMTSYIRSRETLVFLAKVAVTVISIHFVLRSVSWDDVIRSLSEMRIEWFGAALAVFWVAQIVSALRCAYVARGLGMTLSVGTSIRAHFVGLWFNQVLPTGLGGDIVKITWLRNRLGLGSATRVTVIDRISGLMMLLFALSIQLPFYRLYIADARWLTALALASAAVLAGIVVIAAVANRMTGRFSLPFGIRHVGQLLADVWSFRGGRAFWQQFWTSLVVHLNGIACFSLIARSMSIDVSLILLTLTVPVVFIAALLPLSFAGWGVREAGAILVFGAIGMPAESAFGISVTFGALLLVAGLPGLVLWMLKK